MVYILKPGAKSLYRIAFINGGHMFADTLRKAMGGGHGWGDTRGCGAYVCPTALARTNETMNETTRLSRDGDAGWGKIEQTRAITHMISGN